MRRSHVAVSGRFERANIRLEVLPARVSELMISGYGGWGDWDAKLWRLLRHWTSEL